MLRNLVQALVQAPGGGNIHFDWARQDYTATFAADKKVFSISKYGRDRGEGAKKAAINWLKEKRRE